MQVQTGLPGAGNQMGWHHGHGEGRGLLSFPPATEEGPRGREGRRPAAGQKLGYEEEGPRSVSERLDAPAPPAVTMLPAAALLGAVRLQSESAGDTAVRTPARR